MREHSTHKMSYKVFLSLCFLKILIYSIIFNILWMCLLPLGISPFISDIGNFLLSLSLSFFCGLILAIFAHFIGLFKYSTFSFIAHLYCFQFYWLLFIFLISLFSTYLGFHFIFSNFLRWRLRKTDCFLTLTFIQNMYFTPDMSLTSFHKFWCVFYYHSAQIFSNFSCYFFSNPRVIQNIHILFPRLFSDFCI